MTDPLDALRAHYRPVAPDAAFAARLRVRLERAVLNPRGANMSKPVTIDQTQASEGDVAYSSLLLPDATRATAFYTEVLGWHIEAGQITNVTPPMGMRGDVADGTLFLVHAVDDVRTAIAKVRAAGGEAGEPVTRPFGVVADCVDNQGMRFALLDSPMATRRPARQPGAGELLYLTVGVPDSALYRDFYGTVFGWTFTPGRVDDGWSVPDIRPMTGMRGGAPRPEIVPMYGVSDIAAAVATVRTLGGTATDPTEMPYGTTSDCVDDQGMQFYLGQV